MGNNNLNFYLFYLFRCKQKEVQIISLNLDSVCYKASLFYVQTTLFFNLETDPLIRRKVLCCVRWLWKSTRLAHHFFVLDKTYSPAFRPPILIHKVKSFFHCSVLLRTCPITRLSCVNSTALPLPAQHTRAISSSALGYKFQFSCLEPLFLPNGRSEMNTSTLSDFKGRLQTFHW